MAHENTAARRFPGGEIFNFVTVIDGKQVDEDTAFEHAVKTQEFTGGPFKTFEEADKQGKERSMSEGRKEEALQALKDQGFTSSDIASMIEARKKERAEDKTQESADPAFPLEGNANTQKEEAFTALKSQGFDNEQIKSMVSERIKERNQKEPGFLDSFKRAGKLLVGAEQPGGEGMGLLESLIEQTVADLPVIAGTMKGAALGLATGGPPGALLGGVLGGATVKAAQVGTRKTIEGVPEGEDPLTTTIKTAGESLQAGVEETLFGGVPGAGIETKKLVDVSKKALAKKFAKVRGSFSLGQLTDNTIVDFFENIARSGFIGKGTFKEFSKRQASSIENLRQTVSNSFATDLVKEMSEEDLGTMIKHTLNDGVTAFNASSHALFEELTAKAGKIKVDVTDLRRTAEGQLEEFKRIADIGKTEQGGTLLDRVSKLGDDPLTFADAQRLRSNLLDTARGLEPLAGETKAKKLVSDLIQQTDAAMEVAAGGLDGEVSVFWRKANAFHKSGKEAFNDKFVASLILEDKVAASKVGQHILKPDNFENVKKIRRSLRKSLRLQGRAEDFDKVWKDVQAGFWTNAIEDASTDGVLKPSKLLGFMTSRKTGKTLRAAFTPNQTSAMKDFARIAEAARTREGTNILVQFAQAGAIGGLGGLLIGGETDKEKVAGGAAAVLLGPKALAHAFTNPTFVRMLTRGLQTKQGTGAALTLSKQIVKEAARTGLNKIDETKPSKSIEDIMRSRQ